MLDIGTVFCTAQAVFGNGTTVSSTDWISLGVAENFGDFGEPPVVEIIVTTSFATGTSARFQLVAVDDAGANPVVLDTTDAIPIANLVAAGAGIPPATNATEIKLRMSPQRTLPAATLKNLRVQVVNVGNNTAGSISARLSPKAATASPSKSTPSGW